MQFSNFNQGGGAEWAGGVSPYILGIYLLNFLNGNFLKIRFSLFTVAPYKKFASTHPDFDNITKLTNTFLLGEKDANAILYANSYSKEIFSRIKMLKCNPWVLLFKMDSSERFFLKYPLKSGLLRRKVGL